MTFALHASSESLARLMKRLLQTEVEAAAAKSPYEALVREATPKLPFAAANFLVARDSFLPRYEFTSVENCALTKSRLKRKKRRNGAKIHFEREAKVNRVRSRRRAEINAR